MGCWNNFDIDDELRLRKMLEGALGYTIEVQKNDDKYDYDCKVFQYDTKTCDKKLIGFIELEKSEHWIEEYPENWKTDSFLMRKVFIYDRNKSEFTKDLRKEHERTLYLVVNGNETDMNCQTIDEISKLNKVYCNVKNDNYKDWFLRIGRNNNKIIHGKENCLRFINKFFEMETIT